MTYLPGQLTLPFCPETEEYPMRSIPRQYVAPFTPKCRYSLVMVHWQSGDIVEVTQSTRLDLAMKLARSRVAIGAQVGIHSINGTAEFLAYFDHDHNKTVITRTAR